MSFDVLTDADSKRALPGVVATKLSNGTLQEKEGVALASLSGAVTDWTARLGLPDWRPPVVDGRSIGGRSGSFHCGCCGGGSSRCGGGSRTGRGATHMFERALLAAHLERQRVRCGAEDGDTVAVSFAHLEILAVTATAAIESTRTCLEESFWSARLGAIAENHWHLLKNKPAVRSLHFKRPQTLSVGYPIPPLTADGTGVIP